MTIAGSPGDRKVVLMRLLALAEAERLDLRPSKEQADRLTSWFRTRFELTRGERFSAWLKHAGLVPERFSALMVELATLDVVLEHHGEAVDDGLCDHLALHTIRPFIGEDPARP